MRPKMVLKDDISSITLNRTKEVTGSAKTGNTISLIEFVYDPLKPTNTLLGLRKLWGFTLSVARQAGRVGQPHCQGLPRFFSSGASQPPKLKQVHLREA